MSADRGSSSSAAGVCWDLSDLYRGPDDPALDRDLEEAQQRARRFAQAYRGQIACAERLTPDLLLQALKELESLAEQMDRPLVYAHLWHAAQTDDPRRGALLARVREARTACAEHLIFFDLEWVQLEEAAAQRLLADPRLASYRHYLQHKRSWRPHYLSEPEEKVLERKHITGRSAWVRLFDETVAALRFPLEHAGRTVWLTLQEINARLYESDRSLRQAAAQGWTRGLKEQARLLTYLFNNLVLDHRLDCELRHFTDPMQPRHLANEIRPATVESLLSAVERRYDLVQRYYHLKSKLLGLRPLYDYDRYAPLFDELPACDWPTARRLVEESYAAFSPQAGDIVQRFFSQRWIDAELRPGKRSGAFSSSAVPSAHPYILLNYTDKLRDVMTLAHELGHGLHQYMARSVGYLQCDTPLTTAEMASVFGEMLTFERLKILYPQPRTRLALLCSKLEDSFATVFRQVVLTRFEQALHRARREQGELTTEQINELWLAANRPMYGDAVLLTPDYGWWWSYIGHFIHTPFYCYAYAFGELLVLALIQKYRQEGPAFVTPYLQLLAAGGSEAPEVLLARLGLDINEPTFWDMGLALLEQLVDEAEQLAAQVASG
jgi:oligoendopeptidase F